ncbi:hypothetical protein BSKO_06452 [Bryopsis sp. KO-2023]|nr:hypothetical protein BSKO_06452 [Bryopsis sp. KO-2023]
MNVSPSSCRGCNGLLPQRARLSVGLRRLSLTVQQRRPIHRSQVVKVSAGRKQKKAIAEDAADLSVAPSEPAILSNTGEVPKTPLTPTSQALKENPEDVETPNYALWIVSLLAVIGTFYVVVFYAGAGFFYFLSQKVDFKRKDFVPYSETLRLRKEEQQAAISELETGKSAPDLAEEEEPHHAKDPSGLVASESHAGAHQLPFQGFGGESPL